MKKVLHYGTLEMVTFELQATDIFHLLQKAGDVPEGFGFDFDHNRNFGPNEVIEIRASRYKQQAAETICTADRASDSREDT